MLAGYPSAKKNLRERNYSVHDKVPDYSSNPQRKPLNMSLPRKAPKETLNDREYKNSV